MSQPSAPAGDAYRTLDPAKIQETIEVLRNRILERFPESGLSRVCGRLLAISASAESRAERIARPILSLRVATTALMALLAGGLVATMLGLPMPAGRPDFMEFIQVLEAGINDLVLIGAGVFFLVTFEARVKRRRSLAAIHELRVIAHIIDMHQLAMDPDRALNRVVPTASSPVRSLNVAQMSRYLDYCSEMLSLTGKIAALYVERIGDAASVASAGDVESLTTGLSRKIWQKRSLLQSTA